MKIAANNRNIVVRKIIYCKINKILPNHSDEPMSSYINGGTESTCVCLLLL